MKLKIMRIGVVLLCLLGVLDAASLKRGVQGGEYESYYCLPLDTKSEVFSEEYRKNWGEYDHLAIRFDGSKGNPINFFHAVSEVLGDNATWQKEGFFLVFDAKEPIESIEYRLGKSRYPGNLEMVIPIRQQPISRDNLLLFEELPAEYLALNADTRLITYLILKDIWNSALSWALIESGLSKGRTQIGILALLDSQGKPFAREWSEAYLKKPDDTPGIGLLLRVGTDIYIEGKSYPKSYLVVQEDMSPILRLSGLPSIFTYYGFMCWEGRYRTEYCMMGSDHPGLGGEANTLFLCFSSKAEDIRFIKKPNPEDWEDDMEFAGIDAQIRILEKKDASEKANGIDVWELIMKCLIPVFFLFISGLPIITIFALLLFLLPVAFLLDKRAGWLTWLKSLALPTAFFLFVLREAYLSPSGEMYLKNPLTVLVFLLHFIRQLLVLTAFTKFLINNPPMRKKWLKWSLVAASGWPVLLIFQGISFELAGPCALLYSFLLLIMSIAFIVHGMQWLQQRWPNWKGLLLSLVNALGCIEITAIALLPVFLGSSGEGGLGVYLIYFYLILVAVPGTAIYAVVRYTRIKAGPKEGAVGE